MSEREIRLANTMDPQVWVDEWMETIKTHPEIPQDPDTMLGWFANAIMVGYDQAKRESEER
jgi:hypothetical protein